MSRCGAQATLQDIAPDAWASTKDTYISGVSQAANVDAKWVHVTGVSKTAPLVVDTQVRRSFLPVYGKLAPSCIARLVMCWCSVHNA